MRTASIEANVPVQVHGHDPLATFKVQILPIESTKKKTFYSSRKREIFHINFVFLGQLLRAHLLGLRVECELPW